VCFAFLRLTSGLASAGRSFSFQIPDSSRPLSLDNVGQFWWKYVGIAAQLNNGNLEIVDNLDLEYLPA
jgi:hypothetical protein